MTEMITEENKVRLQTFINIFRSRATLAGYKEGIAVASHKRHKEEYNIEYLYKEVEKAEKNLFNFILEINKTN